MSHHKSAELIMGSNVLYRTGRDATLLDLAVWANWHNYQVFNVPEIKRVDVDPTQVSFEAGGHKITMSAPYLVIQET